MQLTSQVEFILNVQKTVVILTEVKTVIENVKLIWQSFKRNAKKNVSFSFLKNGNFNFSDVKRKAILAVAMTASMSPHVKDKRSIFISREIKF